MQGKAATEITTVVLNNGGIRSLVASATLGGAAHPAMLYVHDGRPDDIQRHTHYIKQSEHFQAVRRIELMMEHLYSGTGDHRQYAPGRWFALLSSAASVAVGHGATRLVWSVQVGEAFEKLASISEVIVLVEHAIQLETGKALTIETPLLDLTLSKVVEVGQQLHVPWRLARSCYGREAQPCGRCTGCRARLEAFARANIDDPLLARV